MVREAGRPADAANTWQTRCGYRSLAIGLAFGLLLVALPAAARPVAVPLRLDHDFLRRMLLDYVYTDEGGSTEAWNDGRDCNQLVLSDPSVGSRDGKLLVRTAARARVGAWLMSRCVSLHAWDGRIEVLEEPMVDAASPIVRFRVVDSQIEGVSGGKGLTGNLWDIIKSHAHPRLEEFTVDLRGPLNELSEVLPLFLPQTDVSRTRLLLNSLAIDSARVDDDGLEVVLRMDLTEHLQPEAPDPLAAAEPRAEPTLTAEELQRWDAAWQRWDAFLTFVVLRLAQTPHSERQIQELREVFLSARYDLAAALTGPPSPTGDPVRRLFLRSWTRLRPLLREFSVGLPGEAAVRYLSLIAAADALQAIDDIGPEVGVEISAEGLRRMARLLDPGADDPLHYDTDVDPELRRMLGMGTPLPVPTEPPASSWGSWLVPRAWAADDEAAELSARLRQWVPTRDDLAQYLPLALRILELAKEKTLAKRELAAEYQPLFRSLLLAAAWQESCWRQFVRSKGTVTTLVSSAGSLGMMQINQHVWRGIYDVRWLRDDIGYNANAGGEIMLHYLLDYAIKKGEHTQTGNPDSLARASYAVYNGGPGHLRRYRQPPKNRHLREIDEAFWKKYREVKDGNDLAVRQCYG